MVTNTLTSDTWHPSPQNSKHGIYSHLAPDRGSGGSWKPLPVLPGTPPLKTQPLGCPNALFQGFPLAPRSPHAAPPPPESSCPTPSVGFGVVSLFYPSSKSHLQPTPRKSPEPVCSPPCTSPQIPTPLRRTPHPTPSSSPKALPPPRPRPHALPSTPPLPRPPRRAQQVPSPRPRRRPRRPVAPRQTATALTMKSRRTPESPDPD